MGGRYFVRRLEHIERWMESASAEQCEAMRSWMVALPTGPHQLASGIVERPGRHLYYAYVPNTGAVVTYVALDVPVGVVTIVSVVSA